MHMRKLFILLAGLLAATTLAAESRPDLFFYLADDQNYWDYGYAGNETVSTPNVDRLVDEGVLFTRAYTGMAICAPSRNNLYTGLYPIRNGCYMNHIRSRDGVVSAAGYLREQGYTVALAGKSHVKPDSVFDWDHYWGPVDTNGGHTGRIPLAEVRDFLEKEKGPVCIFFASDFPHGPYPKMPPLKEDEFVAKPHKPSTAGTRAWAAGYYENIRRDDEQLGQLLDLLEEVGRLEKSAFFYASDHGIDGKYSTYDYGLRVPIALRWKGHVEEGSQIAALVHFIDVVPTMVEMAGGCAPKGIDGKSMLPLIKGETDAIHDAVFGMQTYQNIQKTRIFPGRCITTERYKLIVNFNAAEALEKNYGDNPVVNEFLQMGARMEKHRRFVELYDLEADPFEQENLAKDPALKEVRDALLAQLVGWMQEQGDFIEFGKPFPLLKPTLHPLDKTTRFKEVPSHLEGKLKRNEYLKDHY
jgi:uncharacterized sulfatase